MPLDLARARTLLLEVPGHGKLAYCLLRDPRVPPAPKAALLGTLALVLSPIDLPAWIPVVGDLDLLALAVLAVKVFVDACPDQVVKDQRAALRRRESPYDRDLRRLLAAAGAAVRWVGGHLAGHRAVRPHLLEDASA